MSVKSGVAQWRVSRIISPVRVRPMLQQKPNRTSGDRGGVRGVSGGERGGGVY